MQHLDDSEPNYLFVEASDHDGRILKHRGFWDKPDDAIVYAFELISEFVLPAIKTKYEHARLVAVSPKLNDSLEHKLAFVRQFSDTFAPTVLITARRWTEEDDIRR